MKKHPLARAVRADKLCLAALSATLLHYLKDEAEREIPIWRMIAARRRPASPRPAWCERLGQGEVIAGRNRPVGGGSLPEETLPTSLLALAVPAPTASGAACACRPPVIARVEDDRVVLDPRTVLPEQEGAESQPAVLFHASMERDEAAGAHGLATRSYNDYPYSELLKQAGGDRSRRWRCATSACWPMPGRRLGPGGHLRQGDQRPLFPDIQRLQQRMMPA
jgi:hypothetical protein